MCGFEDVRMIGWLDYTAPACGNQVSHSRGHCQLVDQPIQARLGMAYSPDENSPASQLIQESSFPCGDYPPRGLALFPFLPQLSRCRRTAVCTRHYGDLRSDSEVVPQVWPSVCESTPSPASPAWRQVALGRGVPHNPEE